MPQPKNILDSYEELLINKIKQLPMDTWSHPTESKLNMVKLMRYVVSEKLKWNRSEFCEQFCHKIIIKYRLNTGFLKVYNRNIFPLVTDTFPEWDIKAWELKKSKVPAGFWTEETGIDATKWLVENRLSWTHSEVQNSISNSKFHENNLGGMLRKLNMGAIDAIVRAYPNQEWTYLIERAGYKLTKSQAEEIKGLHRDGIMNQRQLAFKYNVTPSNINFIVHGKIYK